MKGRLKYIFQTAFLLLGGGWVFVSEYIAPQIPVIPLRFRALQIVDCLQPMCYEILGRFYLGRYGRVFAEI